MTLEEALNNEFIIDFAKSNNIAITDIKCLDCLDGELFPQYGRAPHKLGYFGKTLDPKDWPENFNADLKDIKPEEMEIFLPVMCGTYYCTNPKCDNHKSNQLVK